MNRLPHQDKYFDVAAVRQQFPILQQRIYNRDLVYFDNGASTQKPQVVLDAIEKYYKHENANVHRGVHFLSQQATSSYEEARSFIRQFIGAKHDHEIIFTKGTTESVNLVATSWGDLLRAGDQILISHMEHHSNIVPWQMLCERKNIELKVIPITDQGTLDLDALNNLLSEKTKLLALTHVSNTLGTINPIKQIISQAHQFGTKVFIDGAQAVQHMPVDVVDLGCDFYAFSSHKLFGPTGVGILYGKEQYLEQMPPYQGGGDMIEHVRFEKTTYNELPFKFEAGTPNICGAIATGAAIRFLHSFDRTQIQQHEQELLHYLQEKLVQIDGLHIIGTAEEKTSIVSFVVDSIHPYDIGVLLDKQGIAVRTGHHCTQPIMERYKLPGTVRASFSLYNTKEEIDAFIVALNQSLSILR